MLVNCNFQRGGGVLEKNPFCGGGMDFSGTTHCTSDEGRQRPPEIQKIIKRSDYQEVLKCLSPITTLQAVFSVTY